MANWFRYLLSPELLAGELADPGFDAGPLLNSLLTNLLNSQNNGFFTDSPFELWFAESTGKDKLEFYFSTYLHYDIRPDISTPGSECVWIRTELPDPK
jgi:hypothetical protein